MPSPPPIDLSKVRPGDTVRIAGGAVVTSANPKRLSHTVKRPYWIKVREIHEDEVRWVGSAGYLYVTPVSNIDALEDYA